MKGSKKRLRKRTSRSETQRSSAKRERNAPGGCAQKKSQSEGRRHQTGNTLGTISRVLLGKEKDNCGKNDWRGKSKKKVKGGVGRGRTGITQTKAKKRE